MADTLKYVIVENKPCSLETEEVICQKLGYFNNYTDAEIKCSVLMEFYDEDEIDSFCDEYGVEQYGIIPVGHNQEVLKGLKANV